MRRPGFTVFGFSEVNTFLLTLVAFLWTCGNLSHCLLCISDSCRSVDGCHGSDDRSARVRCPSDASCFLQVKLQSVEESGGGGGSSVDTITVRAQGCSTWWQYMATENGSRVCFDGPHDETKTCICSDRDFCNEQLGGGGAHSLVDYRKLAVRPFPPPSPRKIDCIDSGILYAGQSYCTYRRSVGQDPTWIRRAHTTGYVALLENSRRDHLCFQDENEIDCYCKTDRCNDRTVSKPLSTPIGAFDDKVTCCRGEIEHQSPLSAITPYQGIEIIRRCSSGSTCKGDYCFIKFRYNTARRTVSGQQRCFNTSSELAFERPFEGMEYGEYRDRILYCRRDYCNELAVVNVGISRATRIAVLSFLTHLLSSSACCWFLLLLLVDRTS